MAFSYCFCHHPQTGIKSGIATKWPNSDQLIQRSSFALETVSRRHSIQEYGKLGLSLGNKPGSRSIGQADPKRSASCRKNSRVVTLCCQPSQIASSVFTLGTVSVLPFYTLMVVAPKAQLTRISMKSYIPYVMLGLLYSSMLYLSWTPDTLQYMFGNSYWMPEFSGMVKMFNNEMTLASAWIHLLAIDLFAARQIYHDGLQNDIETRHSVSLCLLFCPIGVLSHVITKSITRTADIEKQIH